MYLEKEKISKKTPKTKRYVVDMKAVTPECIIRDGWRRNCCTPTIRSFWTLHSHQMLERE